MRHRSLASALLCVCGASTHAALLQGGRLPPLPRVATRGGRAFMEVGSEAQEDAAGLAPPALGADGKPDLSAMSFEERLEYLSSVAPTAAPVENEDDTSLFGIRTGEGNEVMQPWSPKFFMACFNDLREMTWPSSKQTAQTVVTSQIAFVVILVSILLFDAIADGLVRTLLQGQPFSLTLATILKQKPPGS